MGFDIIDPTEDAWQAWVAPETMAARLEEFLTRMGEGIPSDGKETWRSPPCSTRIMEAVLEECGTWETFAAPENHELADGFFRFSANATSGATGI